MKAGGNLVGFFYSLANEEKQIGKIWRLLNGGTEHCLHIPLGFINKKCLTFVEPLPVAIVAELEEIGD
jgi:hypothetical protein